MKKLLLILAILAFVSCRNATTEQEYPKCKGLSMCYKACIDYKLKYNLIDTARYKKDLDEAIHCSTLVCDGNEYCKLHRCN